MSNKTIVIAASAACTLIIILVILLFRTNSQMTEMTEVFSEERDQLKSDFENLYTEYDELHSDNDSLDNLLVEQRARVEQLTLELKTIKASNARRIKELQAELTTMRTVMRSFVVQIDSLNRKNTVLTKENTEMRGRLASAARRNDDLRQQNETLSRKMTAAARLEAKAINVTTLNHKDKKTSRTSKITKIKTAFTLAKNISAPVGMIDVYVRLTRPDSQLLFHSKSDTFKYEDADTYYSAKRSVEYGGEDTESYIIYIVDMGELMEGKYDVELFANGDKIGSGVFEL